MRSDVEHAGASVGRRVGLLPEDLDEGFPVDVEVATGTEFDLRAGDGDSGSAWRAQQQQLANEQSPYLGGARASRACPTA